MKTYLVDTDVTIDYRIGVALVEAFVDPLFDQGIAISVVTMMEVYQGLLRLQLPASASGQLETFLHNISRCFP